MKLVNKRILVTGGTSGIGLELVRQLSPNNNVIVISRSAALSGALPNDANAVKVFQADLANQAQVTSVADTIVEQYSHIDVLINNAAIQNTPEFLSDEFEFEGIRKEIDINFTSLCQLTYLMLPLLLKDGDSVILNVNTGLALAPKRSSAVYCATKGALNSFSQSLRYQLADTNIHVQQAFLPLVETNMTQGRGSGKLTASAVAQSIKQGIEQGKVVNDIGKVKLLRVIQRISPALAAKIMRNS